MVPSEQQPWVGEFGSWHRRLLDNATSERRPQLFIYRLEIFNVTPVSSAVCTCGTLLELLIFLFPPLPGLEDAPQAGQLAVPADRGSVDPRHQATRSQHPLLVHQLYCSYCKRKKGGG